MQPDLIEMRKESELELTLYEQIRQANLLLPEWQKKIDGHKTDFCWPRRRIIVEVMGGTAGFKKGRGAHVREPGYSNDHAFSNERQLEGWTVLFVTKTHINSGEALVWVKRALGVRV